MHARRAVPGGRVEWGKDVALASISTAALPTQTRSRPTSGCCSSQLPGSCSSSSPTRRDRPLDYRLVEANPAFERQAGLMGAIGRTARELVPTLERRWFEVYGQVALTGDPARFEDGSESIAPSR